MRELPQGDARSRKRRMHLQRCGSCRKVTLADKKGQEKELFTSRIGGDWGPELSCRSSEDSESLTALDLKGAGNSARGKASRGKESRNLQKHVSSVMAAMVSHACSLTAQFPLSTLNLSLSRSLLTHVFCPSLLLFSPSSSRFVVFIFVLKSTSSHWSASPII